MRTLSEALSAVAIVPCVALTSEGAVGVGAGGIGVTVSKTNLTLIQIFIISMDSE